MNLHDLSIEICKREGKKVQLSVAQVKEVLWCLGQIFQEMGTWPSLRLFWKIRKKGA